MKDDYFKNKNIKSVVGFRNITLEAIRRIHRHAEKSKEKLTTRMILSSILMSQRELCPITCRKNKVIFLPRTQSSITWRTYQSDVLHFRQGNCIRILFSHK